MTLTCTAKLRRLGNAKLEVDIEYQAALFDGWKGETVQTATQTLYPDTLAGLNLLVDMRRSMVLNPI